MSSKAPSLNHWSVQTIPDPYQAPETWPTAVVGVVADHPQHQDGACVQLPRIVGKREGKILDAEGTAWKFGYPDPAYAEKYPEPLKRLIESLPEL